MRDLTEQVPPEQYILTRTEMEDLIGFAYEVLKLHRGCDDDDGEPGYLEVAGFLDTDMIKRFDEIIRNHGFELLKPGELDEYEDEDEDQND